MTTTVAVAMPSLLELMVNARLSTHLMGLEILLDCVGTEAFDRHRGDAWGYAEQAGFLLVGAAMRKQPRGTAR